ncbi:chromate efflux transporter [Diaphorobacter sp. C33]|uniref:Chromate transporter n=1 Tax=Diaphorobacter nitroreducens TaxID=164759 RepID=A0AAX1WQN9_9BURK|nr:chromate efflux transporter [Diaphorobacter sp. C33]ROR39702.1 chromate transporter [Diaphorobacter nitroreducens]WKK90602.1 chromate efflux transporter [Diaphorobacter sp. C33]
MPPISPFAATRHHASASRVFLIFLRLGLTSFGGPVAHLGYFREEFVARRGWLTEDAYADLVALCQFLPGPASSQVGLALGLRQAGWGGALAAWLGFTLPSALVMALLGLGLVAGQGLMPAGVLHGLKVAAVAVVAQAVWGMARSLCRGPARLLLMALACALALLWPGVVGQVGAMLVAALAGLALWGRASAMPAPPSQSGLAAGLRPRTGALLLAAFAALLVLLPLAARARPQGWLVLADAFYRAGALVFGGGHVVLPLLQAEVVATGWVAADDFLAGYGLAQAVPGPLFTFAAFLGAAAGHGAGGWLGAAVCLVAIFVPAFLLVAGALPFWDRLRHNARARAALAGVNAAVVGLLLAALYHPVWTSAIHAPADLALALAAFAALVWARVPPWLVVPLCGAAGWLLG